MSLERRRTARGESFLAGFQRVLSFKVRRYFQGEPGSLEEVGVLLAGFGAGDRVAESLERLERRILGGEAGETEEFSGRESKNQGEHAGEKRRRYLFFSRGSKLGVLRQSLGLRRKREASWRL